VNHKGEWSALRSESSFYDLWENPLHEQNAVHGGRGGHHYTKHRSNELRRLKQVFLTYFPGIQNRKFFFFSKKCDLSHINCLQSSAPTHGFRIHLTSWLITNKNTIWHW
jgi:hypothetical protein